MAKCVECNKQLGFLSGYKHPIKGKKHIVCSHCLEVVNAEVMKNRDEVTGSIKDIQTDYYPLSTKVSVLSQLFRY